jgi:hypothetical protein
MSGRRSSPTGSRTSRACSTCPSMRHGRHAMLVGRLIRRDVCRVGSLDRPKSDERGLMLRPLFAALVGVSAIAALASAQQPIELSVRNPAHLTRVLGAEHLVHELWISNRAAVSVTPRTVTVLSESRTFAAYQEAELPLHIGRPGLPRNHHTPLVLEPEQEAVVYFWVLLEPNAAPPVRVDHRVEIALAGSSTSPVFVIAKGGATGVVSADDAEVLDAPLRGKGWVAVYEPGMQGGHRSAIYATDGSPRIPGRFAVDRIRLPSGATQMDSTLVRPTGTASVPTCSPSRMPGSRQQSMVIPPPMRPANHASRSHATMPPATMCPSTSATAASRFTSICRRAA